MRKLLLIMSVILTLTSCGKKSAGYSTEELEEIHAREASLKKQLVNKTWHYYDEPQRAIRYNEDGSYEDYLGPGIRYRDYFSSDERSWDIKFCGSLDGDTAYLQQDKKRAEEYYDYNVLVTYENMDGKTKTYTLTIDFSNNDLILGGDKLYEGEAILEHMPEGLSVFKPLVGHVWYLDGYDCYTLFFDDGYCYMTYGVFADGLTNGSYIYRWGYDEENVFLYLMDHYKSDEKVYEDVRIYAIDGALEDNGAMFLQLVDTWSKGSNIFGMKIVDGQDDSAVMLMNSYDQIHNWTKENWGSEIQ